jgi:oxaloacetate decarboxylase gamma subunit
MEPTLLDQGVELMLYGMGTVFVFLAILVVATISMSALVQRFFKAPRCTCTTG